jgi:hypothetical protein
LQAVKSHSLAKIVIDGHKDLDILEGLQGFDNNLSRGLSKKLKCNEQNAKYGWEDSPAEKD